MTGLLNGEGLRRPHAPAVSFTVGVLSDTHIPHQVARISPAVQEAFRGVDLILHAGDLDELCALDDLKPLAPVIAVRGNAHLRFATRSSPHLPRAVHLWIKGQHIVLNHGIPYPGRAIFYRLLGLLGQNETTLNRHMIRDQRRAFPGADVVIFGHSHLALAERHGDTLFVNPGSPVPAEAVGPPSVALLKVCDDGVEAEIVQV